MSHKETEVRLQELQQEKKQIVARIVELGVSIRDNCLQCKTINGQLTFAPAWDIKLFKKLRSLRTKEIWLYARHKRRLNKRLNHVDYILKHLQLPPFAWGGWLRGRCPLQAADSYDWLEVGIGAIVIFAVIIQTVIVFLL